MAAGLPDLVDCARLAEDAAVLERVYELGALPRLAGCSGGPRGVARASFAFSKTPSGRAGARVAVRAEPRLVCQRCMQGFAFPVSGGSDDRVCARRGGERGGLGAGARSGGRRHGLAARSGRGGVVVGVAASRRRAARRRVAATRRASPPSRALRGIGRDAPAVQRAQGFVEENVTGHSTHGSSKKQKDPVEARHAPFAFRARDTRGVDRREERRDPFSASHFARRLLSRPKGAQDQGGRGSRRRIGPSRRTAALCRSSSEVRITRAGAAPHCHRRHERRLRALGLRAGGPRRGARIPGRSIHPGRQSRSGALERRGARATPPMSSACSPRRWWR